MKTHATSLKRLALVKELLEKLAEHELAAARQAADIAARKLAAVQQHQFRLRRDLLSSLLEGDSRDAYLLTLEQRMADISEPVLRRSLVAADLLSEAAAACYQETRREHASVAERTKAEAKRLQGAAEKQDQKFLDEAYAIRRHRERSTRSS